MAKMRVYELAKELKIDNKELVRHLVDMGLDVRNHMSVLSSEETKIVRERLRFSRAEMVEEMRVTTRVIRRRRRPMESNKVKETLDDTYKGSYTKELKKTIDKEVGNVNTSIQQTSKSVKLNSIGEQKKGQTQILKMASEGKTILPVKEKIVQQSSMTRTAHFKSLKVGTKSRRSVDVPARIISRPIVPVVPASELRSSPELKVNRSNNTYSSRSSRSGHRNVSVEVPSLEKTDERRRRKKSKKVEILPDDDYLMRRMTSRRKEILDKVDLYGEFRSGLGKRKGATARRLKKTELTTPKPIKRRIKIGETIIVGELAKRMGIKATEIVMRLMEMGMMVMVNQILDVDEATLVANEFGFELERAGFEEEGHLEQIMDQPEDLVARPPVITIMGHVDHGKTSLLDAIRRSNVVSSEVGGITQHIGAYNVHLPDGNQVVFVDTPGHEAFTQMRVRGAQVTDIVILVVAADDGVMQQTREAISHSRAAGVSIIVAINKIDKLGADSDRVRRDLIGQGLIPEALGGDVIMVEVSAKTGDGLEQLLEMVTLQSEMLGLKANPNKTARGRILEARLDKGRGAVATVLVLDGTLKSGDQFVCGVYAGKARALFSDFGRRVDEATPSIPVEVQGFGGVPEVGNELVVVESEKVARSIAEHRGFKKREKELSVQRKMSLESFFERMKEGTVQELKLVVKADVQGMVEALVDGLNKLGNEQVKVNVIYAATGAVTETDVMLASASQAIIIAFNVRPSTKVIEVAEVEHVDIRTYDIIYHVMDDINAALTGLLSPVIQEEVLGRAEVRQIFNVPKQGTIAGCVVVLGKIERNALARLLRDGAVVVTSKVSSLRRFKEDAKEVMQGFECGIGLESYNDIKVGDEIEVFMTKKVIVAL